MHPRIIDHGHRCQAIVALRWNGADRVFMPFAGRGVRRAVPISTDRVFCLNTEGEACLYSCAADEVVARATIARDNHQVLVPRGGGRLALYSTGSFIVLRSDDLGIVVEADAVRWDAERRLGVLCDTGVHSRARDRRARRQTTGTTFLAFAGPLVEDERGHLLVQCHDDTIARMVELVPGFAADMRGLPAAVREVRCGVYRIDPRDWSVSFAPLDASFYHPLPSLLQWFSPSGRRALRWHFGAVVSDTSMAPRPRRFSFFGRREPPRHRDALHDGTRRFGLALELWTVDPARRVSTIVTRMDQVRTLQKPSRARQRREADERAIVQLLREREEALTLLTERRQQIAPSEPLFPRPENLPADRKHLRPAFEQLARHLREFLAQIHQVVWEPGESAFWVAYIDNAVRRVGLDGTLSPLVVFKRFAAMDPPHLGDPLERAGIDLSVPGRVRYGSSGLGTVAVERSLWSGDAPLVIVSEDEDGFTPAPNPRLPSHAAIDAFVHRTACHRVIVGDLSTDAIRVALRSLTADIRERLAELLSGNVFEVAFQVGDDIMGERDFFARLGPEHVALVPDLRELLTAYLAVYDRVCEERTIAEGICGPGEDAAALASAMAALLRLDPLSHDVFRVFLRKRDGEHELQTVGSMMKDYVGAVGWPDEAAIRFGIYFTLVRLTDGAGGAGLWNEHGLLDAAAGMLDTDAFARLVVDEVERYELPGNWDDDSTDALYVSFSAEVTTRPAGGEALAAAVSRLRPTGKD